MQTKKVDRRTARTRRALINAFALLVHHGSRIESIRIGDIIQQANVGRSTFYEHFKDKSEIFAVTFEPFFLALSGAVDEREDINNLIGMMELCWKEREISRSLLGVANRRVMAKVLRRYIAARLRRVLASSPRKEISIDLVAAAVADAQLTAMNMWVSGEASCDSKRLAVTLSQFARCWARA
jgi:AcrR family transcriptional regulator